VHCRAQTGLFFCLITVLALSLAGCGRRGALEAPPGSPTSEVGANPQATTPNEPALKPAHRANKKIVPPKVDTPFDWLL
jgi:predicted small lipoprotein YifL